MSVPNGHVVRSYPQDYHFGYAVQCINCGEEHIELSFEAATNRTEQMRDTVCPALES